MQFDLPKEQSSIIKVIGVGGGGSNAVNHMFEQGIRGVNFVISNTDGQALDMSSIPNKIQLGPDLTEGLGAGSNPEVGKLATEESLEELKAILEKNTKMVFITAGMGGGTGTGGAPVVAKLAKEMGILTVGIVSTPFFFEGRRKVKQADEGIEEMRRNVDSLIVISNDKIREIYGNLTRSDAFGRADDILTIAAKSISEIITVAGQINVDFADVEYVMKNSGVSIMGSATADGENRAQKAIQGALNSPLLNDNNIAGAQKILLNISSGTDQILIDEITEIHEYVQEAAGYETDVIFGTCDDDSLGDKIMVTVIATGFEGRTGEQKMMANDRVVHSLGNVSTAPAVTPTPPPVMETPKVEEVKPVVEEVKVSEPVRFTLDLEEETKTEVTETTQQEEEFKIHTQQLENEMTAEAVTPVEEVVTPVEATTPVEASAEAEEEDDADKELKYVPGVGFKIVTTPRAKATETKAPEPVRQAPVESIKDPEEQNNERTKRLRNLSLKLNNPNSLTELENEPAFKRRNIQLAGTEHSSEQPMSRFSLSNDEDEETGTGIKKNNSFLHDNVD